MAIDATAETFDKDVQGSITVVDFGHHGVVHVK